MRCYEDELACLTLQDAIYVTISASGLHECAHLHGKTADFTLIWNYHATFRGYERLTGKKQNIFFFCAYYEFSREQCHKYIEQKIYSLTLEIRVDDYTYTIRLENGQMMLTIILVCCIAGISMIVLLTVYFVHKHKQEKKKVIFVGDTEIDPLVLEKPGLLVDSGITSKLL